MARKTNIPPAGRDGARPLQKNGSKLAHGGGVRLGCGFRQPNSETEFGASVMVTPPYGCVTGSAQQRADVGIGPYGCVTGGAQQHQAGAKPAPFCSLLPPLAALANVPLCTRDLRAGAKTEETAFAVSSLSSAYLK